MSSMPLTDSAWAMIVAATYSVQGRAFWMSRRTWMAMNAERPRPTYRLYSVPVLFDDAMTFGVIKLERRDRT